MQRRSKKLSFVNVTQKSCMSPVGCALRGVTICHPAAELGACVLPQSPPIIETAVDREPWSAGLTRITWIPARGLGGRQSSGGEKAALL